MPTEAKEDKGLNGQEFPNQENESNHIVAEPKNEGQFGLVSDERMEELKRKQKEEVVIYSSKHSLKTVKR